MTNDNADELNEALARARDAEQRAAEQRDELFELLEQMTAEQRRAFLAWGRALAAWPTRH